MKLCLTLMRHYLFLISSLDIKLVIWPSCVHIMTPLEGSSVAGR